MEYLFLEYPRRDQMMKALAKTLADELRVEIEEAGRASIAVPGGSTPGPIFDALSETDLDWSKVTVMPGDDRWVPETSEYSNARLIKARLMQNRAGVAQFFGCYLTGDEDEAVKSISLGLAPHLPLTTALLGMGGDMHTASLFPGNAILGKTEQGLVHYVPVPGLEPIVPRMTLTPLVLNEAEAKHILITGADKKQAFLEAVDLGDPVRAPILSILSGATVHWAE